MCGTLCRRLRWRRSKAFSKWLRNSGCRTHPSYFTPANEALRKQLYGQSSALLEGVFMGFPTGEVFGYNTAGGNELLFGNSSRVNNGTSLAVITYRIDATTGLPTLVQRTIPDFDVRKDIWYKSALTNNASATWAPMRLLSPCNCIGTSVSLQIIVGNKFVAAICTVLRLKTISNALSAAKVGVAGEVFVMDEVGSVVGMSNPQRVSFTFSRIVAAKSVDDPLLRDAVHYLLNLSGGRFDAIPAIDSVRVTLAGRAYLLGSMHLTQFRPLNWTCVVLIPHADYFEPTDTALLRAVAIGSAIVLLIIVAMAFLSWLLLTLPLRRLSRGMDDIADSLHGPRLPKDSFIHEVAVMERAYGNMATGLSSFSKYVPGPVVQELLKTSREPQVGVAPRECTFFFSDISDFTSISEVTEPARLNLVVSEYFSAMEAILHRLRGITTDFLGDGLFVFWNAPCLQPDHALLACEAALQQQERMLELRRDWQRRGLPEMQIRIGINTGPCLVGNFGSHHHLKYTVMGDAVNVASRLEQLNKHFGTAIIIGHATYCQVHTRFVGRPLALVTLKGKSEPTRVYQLVCRVEDATEPVLLLAEQSARLVDAYLQHDFATALTLCRAILQRHPDDAATLLLRDSCVERYSSHSHFVLPSGTTMDAAVAGPELPIYRALGNPRQLSKLPSTSLAPPAVIVDDARLATVVDWSFDAFLFSDDELMVCARHMFACLGLVDHFGIAPATLDRFLMAVRHSYKPNPYHNWRHACDVAQAVVAFLVQFDGQASLSKLDTLVLLVAALGHDLNHPGVSSDFLIKTDADLAVLYNHQSVLENMHCCALLRLLLGNPDANVLASLPAADFAYARKAIIGCILATDMAAHGAVFNQLCAKADSGATWLGPASGAAADADRLLLMKCVLKMADISNVARPWGGAGYKWAVSVTEEFFKQGDLERSLGLPVVRLNDRHATTMTANSLGFMDYVAVPFFVGLGRLHPKFERCVVALLRANREICAVN